MSMTPGVGVAIAFNLLLVVLNVVLLLKIQRWHRHLRQLRQKLSREERRVHQEVDTVLEAMVKLDGAKEGLVDQQQKAKNNIQKLLMLMRLYRYFPIHKKIF